MHLTDRFIAENPVGMLPVDVSYWYIGLKIRNTIGTNFFFNIWVITLKIKSQKFKKYR